MGARYCLLMLSVHACAVSVTVLAPVLVCLIIIPNIIYIVQNYNYCIYANTCSQPTVAFHYSCIFYRNNFLAQATYWGIGQCGID